MNSTNRIALAASITISIVLGVLLTMPVIAAVTLMDVNWIGGMVITLLIGLGLGLLMYRKRIALLVLNVVLSLIMAAPVLLLVTSRGLGFWQGMGLVLAEAMLVGMIGYIYLDMKINLLKLEKENGITIDL
jgi:hypothetical protein